MGFGASIIRMTSNLILFVLFLRYLTYGYGYGTGVLFQAIYRITDAVCRPLRRLFPYRMRAVRDYSPLAAMVVVLVIRGLFFSVLRAPRVAIPTALEQGMQVSFLYFIGDGLMVAFVLLLIGAGVRSAGGIYGVTLLHSVWEMSEKIFERVQKVFRTRSLLLIYMVSILIITLPAALVASLILWTFRVYFVYAQVFLSTFSTLLWIYGMGLLIRIILSWLQPNPTNPIVMMLHAIFDPALYRCQQLFPWARIDLFNLSPIFLFIGVSILQGLVKLSLFHVTVASGLLLPQ